MWSLSVPTWGSASVRMLSGAPQDTSASMMKRWRRSRVPVFSLPSENVPAPPSPNWTFERTFSSPVAQKRSTSRRLRSTHSPRSSRIGRAPQRASTSAANSPAGPAPITTGRTAGGAIIGGSS